MAYAFSLINGVTLQGQVAIGLSGALRGNGMCLSTRGLDRVPWRAHGLAEDLEYSWMVRIAGGHIGFAREARVYASMPTDDGEAWDHQRRRWETGRHQLRGRMLPPLLRSPHLGPLAKLASVVELTMPTTSWLCGAYLLLTLILGLRLPDILSGGGSANLILLAISHAIATAALLLQLTSPFVLSFLPWSFASCLLHFPYYAGWKAFIALGARPGTWVRTAREPVEPKP
jgi:cellulose synthase/poly-beta-1,6-N-acetylglucosamine synthase-like glycosyltransferase